MLPHFKIHQQFSTPSLGPGPCTPLLWLSLPRWPCLGLLETPRTHPILPAQERGPHHPGCRHCWLPLICPFPAQRLPLEKRPSLTTLSTVRQTSSLPSSAIVNCLFVGWFSGLVCWPFHSLCWQQPSCLVLCCLYPVWHVP